MTVTDFLAQNVPFLTGLSEGEAHTLAENAEQTTFKTGQTIIMQGVTVDGLHVIASGKVAVWIKPPGKTAVQVATLGPGDVFGERSIVEFGVAGATIKAAEETLIFIIRQDAFLKVMEDNPSRKQYILDKIAERRKPLAKNPTAAPAPPAAPGTPAPPAPPVTPQT